MGEAVGADATFLKRLTGAVVIAAIGVAAEQVVVAVAAHAVVA